MISVHNLTKQYGKHMANENVNLTINEGEIGILLGSNGAGKSTLIKCICGLLRYTGDVAIDGFESHTLEAKRLLGYVPEFPAPYPLLTVDEHLEFIARAYRLSNWRERADELLVKFDLYGIRNKLGKELSKGMRQKLSVCCALLSEPKAVIFDEPFVGLDPRGIRELKNTFSRLREEGRAVLISTHIIDSVEDSWDVTFIMQNGRIAREIRRNAYTAEKLEDIFFDITEGKRAVS